MIDIDFDILFTVQILHEYYHDEVCPDFTFMPSVQTAQVLNGYKMVWKQLANTLYVGIQTGGASPLVVPDTTTQFTFFISCGNPLFSNYTNIPSTAGQQKLFYFSNLNNNIGNSRNFLSQTMDPYSSAKDYYPGDLVVSAGVVYESIQVNKSATSQAVDKTAYWRPVDANRYVTSKDLLPTAPTVADEIKGKNIYGQVDIFNTAAVPVGYQLLGAMNALLAPVYSICFLNRATKWKYFLPAVTGRSITDTNTDPTKKVTFSIVSGNIISDTPIPLSDTPLKLKLLNGVKEIANPIPCPPIHGLAKGTDINDPFLYSEIYLNY